MIIYDEYTIECLKSYLPAEFQPRLVVPFDVQPEELVAVAAQSSAEVAEGIANSLKSGVEHTADSDTELALQLSNTIIEIGEACEEGNLIGLGTMSKGDAFAHSGQLTQAWQTFESAGDIYREAGNEVGWARTRIGTILIGSEIGPAYAQKAFIDAPEAERVFLNAQRFDRLQRLYHNWAMAYFDMGKYEEAVELYQKAVETVNKQEGQQNSQLVIAFLYSDMGYAYNNLGKLNAAMDYLTQARQIMVRANQLSPAAMTEFAMASNYIIRGEYRQALHLLLNSVIPNLSDHYAHRKDSARLVVVECYLALNRDQEAYELAQEVLTGCQSDPHRSHATGLSALLLATAQARLHRWAEAKASLNLAETCFATYEGLVALTRLRRSLVALREGDFQLAQEIAHTTAEQFKGWQQYTNWIDSVLIEAEAALTLGDINKAYVLSHLALSQARDENWLPARYRCYLMLGQILEQKGRVQSSIRLYQGALAILRRMQRSLTVSMRTGFLEDKLLPFHHLMHLYLGRGQVDKAFETLEQLKSQVFQNYVMGREHLHWPETDQTRALLEKLHALRDQHQWYMHLQMDPPLEESEVKPWHEEAGKLSSLQHAILDCEKQMRQITNQLYLFSATVPDNAENVIQLKDIQKHLNNDTILLEFYVDQEHMWCFAVNHDSLSVHQLTGSAAEIQQLVNDKWTSNLDFALRTRSEDTRIDSLTVKAQRILEKLAQLLLQPLEAQLSSKKRLIMVPFGFLHRVPFNILRQKGDYLIEKHEIITLPSAILLLQPQTMHEGGAMVMAHSWGGKLQYSIPEGQMVHQIMGGDFFSGEEAQRSQLQNKPQKALHISTHAEHYIDRPDFSYIELSDGPAYTDDLLQCDLSYELVTLSACETGRANVTAGDELVGLGRGFLYAGAGALITSLWQVNEMYTYHLMESLYQSLCEGKSKAQALQKAQCELLSQNANLHPAFWGAFQLIGNAEPLSHN